MTETKMTEEIIEKLAEIEHERWSHWHKHAVKNWNVAMVSRWNEQANTPYSELSGQEKDSDRREVMRYWPIIVKYLEQREKISEKENQVHLEMIYRLQDELKQEREKNDEQYKSFQEWKKVYFEKSKKLLEAAEGLSYGTDWNNGTHAKLHGYRQKLLDALSEYKGDKSAGVGEK